MDAPNVAPKAIGAEQSVLGGLMLSPTSLAKIADWLTEDDFFDSRHRLIYRAIAHLVDKDTPCDPVTMAEWLASKGLEARAGGMAYVIELANATPSAANVVAYAEIVAEKSRLRQAMDVAAELMSGAAKPGCEAGMVVAEAMQRLTTLQTSKLRGGLQPTKPLLKSWFAELHRRYEAGDRVTGLPTPWHAVNTATHGLQDGELILLPARPNMGKSVAGFQLSAFTALRGGRTAVFSLEMTATQVMRRCIASMARVPHDWLAAPTDEGDSELYWPRIMQATSDMQGAQLLIDDEPSLTIAQIRARALREHMRAPLRLVVVDHMHIVRRPGENDVRELGDISRGLKALAKELNCPVVALAQLNRGLNARTDKRPVMSDLRASGEIEQDGDLILFLHREDYYDRDTHLQGVIEMEIGKGRDVKTGQRIYLANRFDEMRIEDWEGALPEPPEAPQQRAGGFRRGFGRGNLGADARAGA